MDDKIRARVEKHSSSGKKLKQTQANPKKRARTPEPDSDAGVCECIMLGSRALPRKRASLDVLKPVCSL